MVLVPRNDSAEIMKPSDGSFDFPSFSVPLDLSSILGRRTFATLSMRANQCNAPFGESVSQRITVGRFIVNESLDFPPNGSGFDQLLDQTDIVSACCRDKRSSWNSVSVNQNHRLGSFASLRFSNVCVPFFADENDASAINSLWLILPRRSSLRRRRPRARSQTPSSVHRCNRRQQVAGDGKHVGRSCHRAPVRSTQRIPSTHERESHRGRPPCGLASGLENKSEIRPHWSSVSCFSGSVMVTRDNLLG